MPIIPPFGQPESTLTTISARLRRAGWAFAHLKDGLSPSEIAYLCTELRSSWSRLPPDTYLKDRGGYRFRRHASYVQPATQAPERVAHRAHWQPTTYNALHGGIERWFDPIEDRVATDAAFNALLGWLGGVFASVDAAPRWFIEAHQFRIDATQGVGKPTPEGAHRDGVDFVALLMVRREDVEGGATTIVDADGKTVWHGELREPGTLMLLDDRRVMHETTAITSSGPRPYRDTLVLTYRSAGFMDPHV